MARRSLLCALLLGTMLCKTFPVSAEELAIHPSCETTLYYSAGTVEVHLDNRFSYSTVEVHRLLEEGQFLYYRYRTELAADSCLYFPLIEGDYVILLTIPSAKDTGSRTFSFSCTIGDPDMDAAQSFDSSTHCITLDCDENSNVDLTANRDLGVIDRVYTTSTEFTMGGRGFCIGDISGDGTPDANDAALLLTDAAMIGSGGESTLSAMQQKESDVSLDGSVDAVDASVILQYSTSFASGQFSGTLLEFIQ